MSTFFSVSNGRVGLARIALSDKERKYGDPAIQHHEVFSAGPNVLLAMLHYASGRCSSLFPDRFDFALASRWALTTGFMSGGL